MQQHTNPWWDRLLGQPLEKHVDEAMPVMAQELARTSEIPEGFAPARIYLPHEFQNVVPDDNVTYYFETMIDARLIDRLSFVVRNNTDQTIAVTVVGSDANSPNDNAALQAMTSFNVTSGEKVGGVTLNLDDLWMPWIGLTFTPSIAPTNGGTVQAAAHAQMEVLRAHAGN